MLTQFSLQSHQKNLHWNPRDCIDHLSDRKKAGWQKLISSIATTEELEQTLMIEIEKAFEKNPEIKAYLASQKLDEFRHQQLLKLYLLNSFQYVKTHRTFTDTVIYDKIFPGLAKLFCRKPIYGLALIFFFENYGCSFYKNLKLQAEQDGLPMFTQLIEQIEKDELRHLAGIKLLISSSSDHFSKSRISFLDKTVIRIILFIAVFDLNMNFFAWHNRKVRKSVCRIGLNPLRLTADARNSARLVLKFVSTPHHYTSSVHLIG